MHPSKRTVTCGQLNNKNIKQLVTLNGWISSIRNHGGITFADIRDRYGITQVIFDTNNILVKSAEALLPQLKLEYCISVTGKVGLRPENMINKEISTGEIEVYAEQLEIISTCEILPFMVNNLIKGHTDAREELRLKHRYIDLRSARMQRNIILRHEIAQTVRAELNNENFLEIETPTLVRSTPEGARDFIIPSRLQPGQFYALPQSPQMFKQLLMLSGYDRYYQFARCYRDEDARGDRQPEFTQLDFEMSFVNQQDVLTVLENLFIKTFKTGINYSLVNPFIRLTFEEAMNRFGTDRPDLRFDLELSDFTELAKSSNFAVFKNAINDGAVIKALRLPQLAIYSRKQIEELEEHAKLFGAKGLAWMKCTEAGLTGGISRFFEDQEQNIRLTLNIKPGDLLLFVAAPWRTACTALGAVRTEIGKQEKLYKDNEFKACFITEFPLFNWNDEDERWESEHHMFSMPKQKFLNNLTEKPGEIRGQIYDAVINGIELASGSIRIHDPNLQAKIFEILGLSKSEIDKKFGFLLEAFHYGTPPHGGAAIGFDRLLMLMAGESTIRDVIPFPKNTLAGSPLDGSPATVDTNQLKDLNLYINHQD